uniref:Uncharacterized protein n=1 Tax=Solanum tuberosum TaxID=4113 RepID=M1AR40_SOLTU
MDVMDANLVTPMDNRLQKELDIVASIMKVALDCCAESPTRRTKHERCCRNATEDQDSTSCMLSMFCESLVPN